MTSEPRSNIARQTQPIEEGLMVSPPIAVRQSQSYVRGYQGMENKYEIERGAHSQYTCVYFNRFGSGYKYLRLNFEFLEKQLALYIILSIALLVNSNYANGKTELAICNPHIDSVKLEMEKYITRFIHKHKKSTNFEVYFIIQSEKELI